MLAIQKYCTWAISRGWRRRSWRPRWSRWPDWSLSTITWDTWWTWYPRGTRWSHHRLSFRSLKWKTLNTACFLTTMTSMETHHKSRSPRDTWSPWKPCLPLVSLLSFDTPVSSCPLWWHTHCMTGVLWPYVKNLKKKKLTQPARGTNVSGTMEREEQESNLLNVFRSRMVFLKWKSDL